MFADLPNEVLSTLLEFRTCEFTTLSKGGAPVTWPVSARYLENQGIFILTTSLGFTQKAYNIRRNPRVSLLFSNPTASGLTSPAAVLVQGDAVASDAIYTSPNATPELSEYWSQSIFSRQFASSMISTNPLMLTMMDWYFMRIAIQITPRTISWWPGGNFEQPALQIEASDVE